MKYKEYAERFTADNLETKKLQMQGLTQEAAPLETLSLQRMELQTNQRRLQQAAEQLDQSIRYTKELENRQEEYCSLQEKVQKRKYQLDQMERMFLDAQAGLLAQTLHEGAPCPVCGSLEHPSPAVKVEEVATREQLDEEKAHLERGGWIEQAVETTGT